MLKPSISALLLILGALASSAAQTPFRGTETRVAVSQDVSLSPSEYLARLRPARRQAGRLDVELAGAPTAEVLARRSKLANHWREGRYNEALDALRALEDEGWIAGVGIGWRRASVGLKGDVPAQSPDFVIDASNAADQVMLGSDPISGHFFAVVRWGSSWSFYISPDQGTTWSESYRFSGGRPISFGGMDVDVHQPTAGAGAYAYVAYVVRHGSTGHSAALIRRFSAVTGAPDESWGVNTVAADDTGDYREVGIAIGGGLINYLVLRGNGSVECRVSSIEDGTTWTPVPTLIDTAERGLDVAYASDDSMFISLWVSYLDRRGRVMLGRRAQASGFMSPISLARYDYTTDKTSVAASLDEAVVSWQYRFGESCEGVKVSTLRATSASGDDLNVRTKNVFSSPCIRHYDPLVAAGKGGRHHVMIFTTEAGDVVFWERDDGFTGWSGRTPVNQYDVVPERGDTFAIEWLGQAYGIAYQSTSGTVFFKKWPFSDDSKDGDTSTWIASNH